MKRIKGICRIASMVIFLPGFYSCISQPSNDTKKQAEITAESTEGSISDSISIFYLLPSPGEIILRFYKSDFPYNPALLNSPANKDKYIGSTAQTLNLGIYITDMAYCALYERTSETVNYLETIQTLCNETGISSGVFESLLVRSKANTERIDSLFNISNEAFINMIEFLETGGNENAIAHISAGAYIESLYLALETIGKFTAEDPNMDLLVEMKYPVDNLLEKIKNFSASEKESHYVSYLKQISSIFEGLETKSAKTTITESKTGTIKISGGDQTIMSETSFNNLKQKVSEIRKDLVNF